MCGIAGIIACNDIAKEHIVPLVGAMCKRIEHRGPDGEGFFNEHNIALGHRRLSIIDLSDAGHQPMFYADRYVITYNGEVYNYIELTEELMAKGYQFASRCDTEVILAAYMEWGEEALHHFNGMFSFAIYDRETGILFCARDRFGVKPFYYARIGDFFVFGSEIKQFVDVPGWKPVVNKDRAYDYLTFGIQDHTHETMFSNVFQLSGGHSLIFDTRTSQYDVKKWYDIKRTASGTQKYEDSVKELETLFKSAVSFRLRADVKVGSCLSGGIDSSSIVCVMNSILRELNAEHLQETISSCFTDKKYDEQEYIDAVIKKTGAVSHKIFPQANDLLKELDSIVWHQDEPFGSTSIFAQWSVFRGANREHITVMLDGQGADEVFGGYHTYFGPHLLNLFSRFKIRTALREWRYIRGLKYPSRWIGKEIFKNLVPPSFFRRLKEPSILDYKPSEKAGKELKEKLRYSSVEDMSYKQLRYTNLPMLLHWEDRDSMAFSIESRVPFLDYRLVEYAFNMPAGYKLRNAVTKKVLRDAMGKYVPSEILERKDKMGFVTPENVWLSEHKEWFEKELTETVERANGLVNKHILEILQQILKGERNFDFIVWRAVCFGRWLKVFNVTV